MTLSDYLTKKQITSEQFAKKLKVSVSSINKWRMRGYRIPRRATLLKIERATKGSVRAEHWYS